MGFLMFCLGNDLRQVLQLIMWHNYLVMGGEWKWYTITINVLKP